jgi:hypothetical protein
MTELLKKGVKFVNHVRRLSTHWGNT